MASAGRETSGKKLGPDGLHSKRQLFAISWPVADSLLGHLLIIYVLHFAFMICTCADAKTSIYKGKEELSKGIVSWQESGAHTCPSKSIGLGCKI